MHRPGLPLWVWRIFSVAWLGVIAWMSRAPFSSAHTRSRLALLLAEWAGLRLSTETLTLVNVTIRKTAHFLEYAVLTFLLYRSYKGHGQPTKQPAIAALALLSAVAYSLTDEYHQLFVPGRGSSLLDTGLDMFGGICALLWLQSRDRAARNGVKDLS